MTPKYDTILFDADGTLLDFARSEEMALQKTFAAHHFPLDDAIKARYQQINNKLWSDFEQGLIEKGQILRQRFARLFAELGIDYDGFTFNNEFLSNVSQGFYTIDGAEQICQALAALLPTLFCHQWQCSHPAEPYRRFWAGTIFFRYLCL